MSYNNGITVHAGHNPDGMVGCGAVGIGKESTMNREVVKWLMERLVDNKVLCTDITVNNGTSAGDVLAKLANSINEYNRTLNISIHHNAGANDRGGNGKTTGCEVYIYPGDVGAYTLATQICENLASLGYKDRGVKEARDLYIINKTRPSTILVECCFIDDKDDMDMWDARKIGYAIADAIMGVKDENYPSTPADVHRTKWVVKATGFGSKAQAEAYLKRWANDYGSVDFELVEERSE